MESPIAKQNVQKKRDDRSMANNVNVTSKGRAYTRKKTLLNIIVPENELAQKEA
jgi:hypothetical protein